MPLYMNDLTHEEAEQVRRRAEELCTCGGAGIPPWSFPCGGHIRAALDEHESLTKEH